MSFFGAALFNLYGFFASLNYKSPVRVTCIGDSITEGACGGTYVDILKNLLGSDYTVTNAGKSAQTMLKKGIDFSYDNNIFQPASYWATDAWQTALNSDPDIVTIMLGTNDAKAFNWEGVQQNTGDYYALDYVAMIDTLRRLKSRPKIYILVPAPLYAPFPYEMNKTIINEIYPVLVRDIATVTGTTVIDIHSALLPFGDLTCDGCHPTAEGNEIIAQTIAEAIVGKKVDGKRNMRAVEH